MAPFNFSNLFYHLVLKRTYTYVAFVVAGAIGVEYVVDKGVNAFWDNHNKGKQFKDLENEYREKGLLRE